MKRMSLWLFAGLILGLSGCCGAKQCLLTSCPSPCAATGCILTKLGTCLADKKAKLCHLKAHLCNKHKACMATKCGLPHCGKPNCSLGSCGGGLCETSVYASPQGVVASPQGVAPSAQGMPMPYPSPQYGLPFYGVPGYSAAPTYGAPSYGSGQAPPVGAVPPPPLTQPTSYAPACSGDPATCVNNAGRGNPATGYCNHCGRGGSDSDQAPPPPAISANSPPLPSPSAAAPPDYERTSAPAPAALESRARSRPRIGTQGALRALDARLPVAQNTPGALAPGEFDGRGSMAAHHHNEGGVSAVEVIPASAEEEEGAPSAVIHLEAPAPARGRSPLGANGTGAGRPTLGLEHEAFPDRAVRPVPRNVSVRNTHRDPVMGWASNLADTPTDPELRPARLVPMPREPKRTSVVGKFFQQFQAPECPRVVDRTPHSTDEGVPTAGPR